MDNYIFKKINEGFDREKRVLTFTDDNEHILNTSLDLKPTVGRIFSVDLNRYITTYSIFRRIKDTERNGDANPVLYALKGENDWEFSSLYNRNMFWKRFKVLLKRFLNDHRNEFDTTIVIPSSNRLNSDFVKEIEKLAKEVGITHISNVGFKLSVHRKLRMPRMLKIHISGNIGVIDGMRNLNCFKIILMIWISIMMVISNII